MSHSGEGSGFLPAASSCLDQGFTFADEVGMARLEADHDFPVHPGDEALADLFEVRFCRKSETGTVICSGIESKRTIQHPPSTTWIPLHFS